MNRRQLLAAGALAASPLPLSAKGLHSTDTPIQTEFRAWYALWIGADDASRTDEENAAYADRLLEIEDRIGDLPAKTPQDVIAKMVAMTGFGYGGLPDERQCPALWAEAMAHVRLAPII
ncbi:hypothetical protein [Frigidibacter sp. MR17.24]|uniref:hypothetical protein n=1 Tax=Frigidibacter sp. MR17.24 TaxID=3127345 RepID=UPI003012EE63